MKKTKPTTDQLLKKLGLILMCSGAGIMAVIFAWVLVVGGWSNTPKLIQFWGSIVRSFSDIPIIGNLSIILWVIVFIGPGWLLQLLGERLESKQ